MKPNNSYNPAFPFHIKLRNKEGDEPFRESIAYGLTKRELFAAMAMQGLCANAHGWCENEPQDTVLLAIEHADALIAELETKGDNDGPL